MRAWLEIARFIDRINERLGRVAVWLVLVTCVISAGNAASRYALGLSSNAWLELQWYLFTAMVLLGAPFVLTANGHVRVDVLYSRAQPRTRVWIDLLGLIFFLLPTAGLIAYLSWPLFIDSFQSHEMSGNAGGLLRWPVKLLLPIGFVLLVLQGVAEVIKRIAHLRGLLPLDSHYEAPVQ